MPTNEEPKPGEPGWKKQPGDPVEALISEVWADEGKHHALATKAYLWHMEVKSNTEQLLIKTVSAVGLFRRLVSILDGAKRPVAAKAAEAEAQILELVSGHLKKSRGL